jgi:DNA-binding phage protein
MPKSVSYHAYLIESLKDPKEADAYIKAAIEEDDPELLRIAQRNVIEAQNLKNLEARGAEQQVKLV